MDDDDSGDDLTDADRLLNAWNAEAPRWGWSRVSKFTEGRKTKARARIKTYGIDECLKAVKRAGMAAMFNNGNPPQWFTFDFIVKNDENISKIMEGKYDRDFRSKGSGWDFSR